MLETQLGVAERAARQAGRLLIRHFTRLEKKYIHTKSRAELVTDFDRQANRLIIRQLLAAFPEDGVVAEEGGDRTTRSGYTWIVDPLDGTTNFVTRLPYFCVSIALMVNGVPILGLIYAPLTNECFTAVVGHGARLNGRPTAVSRTNALKRSIIAVSYGHSRQAVASAIAISHRLRLATNHLRHAGSAALDLANLAAGRIDATVMAGPLRSWDVAAGIVIAREAGGEVSDAQGQPFTWRSKNLLVSNGRLHPTILARIRS